MSLKVLTFGWEFPPHISGGLGTACFGLTKSLLEQGTEILFVVPRAHGDEEIQLINASDIPFRESLDAAPSDPVLRKIRGQLSVVAVKSEIVPYSCNVGTEETLQDWKYSLERNTSAGSGKSASSRYRFSGTYGPRLLEEVVRYADVGAVIAKQHDFDVIHAHDWLTFPAGIAARKRSGKPLVVHVHATEYDRAGANTDSRVLAIERLGMEQADRIVAVSNWTKKILVSRYGIAPKKISVIHNGVMPANSLNGSVHAKSMLPGKHVVTFLGRVTYQKGPAYFVEAARHVLRKFPDTHFVVAGSGDLLPAVIEQVARLGLSSRFHFTGFLRGTQVDRLWSMTDVYVMPSVSEPFGIAPLEAIGAGVPVIISHQSGVAEVMPHAIKTNFWDVDALASAICRILRHKSLSRTLRTKSSETLRGITWHKAATKLNKIYHEISAKKA